MSLDFNQVLVPLTVHLKSRLACEVMMKSDGVAQPLPCMCLVDPVSRPERGQNRADAGSIGPVLALFWLIMACLQGMEVL